MEILLSGKADFHSFSILYLPDYPPSRQGKSLKVRKFFKNLAKTRNLISLTVTLELPTNRCALAAGHKLSNTLFFRSLEKIRKKRR